MVFGRLRRGLDVLLPAGGMENPKKTKEEVSWPLKV
jgi:hypothetical protein